MYPSPRYKNDYNKHHRKQLWLTIPHIIPALMGLLPNEAFI